jgi:hypothetical protein
MAIEATRLDTILTPALLSAPRAYYRMEEPAWDGLGGDVKDSSGNARHASSAGGATTVDTGKLGRCGNFVEALNQYVSFPLSVFNQDAGTWACWVKMDPATSDVRLFNSLASGGAYSYFRTFLSGGVNLVWVVGNGTINISLTLGAFTLGAWHLVIGTWEYRPGTNDTVIKGYIDGVSGNTQYLPGKVFVPDTSLTTMVWASSKTTGLLDEFGIWGRALSADERAALYNAGAGRIVPAQTFNLDRLDATINSDQLEVTLL